MYKKIFTTALFAFASAVFLFSLCPAEEAESITVGEGGKFRKLTEALETAQDGDEIVFLPGEHVLDVQTDKAVRLTARDGNATTVSGRLTLNADGVELIGIRFKKVRLNSYKFVVFRNCEFEQPVNGLGLTVPKDGKVPQHAQLVGCTFHSIDDLCLYSLGFVVGISSCSFYAEGERKSCFELHDSDFAISGSTFKADKRMRTVELFASTAVINDCIFTGSVEYAINAIGTESELLVENCEFSLCKKAVESDGLLNVKGSTFTDCQTALRSKQTWAEDCVFESCVFGIAVGQGKSLITRNCTFRNCTEDAIDALIPSSIKVSGCTFSRVLNRAMKLEGSHSAHIRGCTFTDNRRDVLLIYSDAELTDCTFASAEEYSIGLERADKAIVRNCTFTGSPKCAIAARNSELNVYDCGIQLERCVLATFEECEVRFERTEMTLAGDAGTPFINIVKREVTASLTMKDCTVSGPAVAVNNLNSTLNIEGCTFKDCAKAVEAAAGVVHIRDCNLRDCEYGVHIHSGGSAIVETTTFENCTSRAMVLDNTHPTLRDLTFRDCKWGLVLSASQKVEVHNCKFFECNSALGIIGCSVEVSDLRVVGSVGGIKSANSTLKISNTVFDRTEVSVQTKNVQLTVQNSTFKDGASGVNSDGRAAVSISGCSFTAMRKTALKITAASLNIRGSTFERNNTGLELSGLNASISDTRFKGSRKLDIRAAKCLLKLHSCHFLAHPIPAVALSDNSSATFGLCSFSNETKAVKVDGTSEYETR